VDVLQYLTDVRDLSGITEEGHPQMTDMHIYIYFYSNIEIRGVETSAGASYISFDVFSNLVSGCPGG